MAFNIQQFTSQLSGDGARPNLFQIMMPFPALVQPGAASQKITFMARAAQLPGVSQGIVPMYFWGREVKLRGNKVFADWSITVINDTDFAIRNAFERWSSLMNGHVSNLANPGFTRLSDYSVAPQVQQFDMEGNVIKTYNMFGVWPNDIAPIDLDWSSNDSIEEFTVSLAVQYWTDTTNQVN